jgi:DNA-binding MurR/RpiR family transcriptional regulator
VHDTVVFMFISRVDAMRRIQILLRDHQFEEAIGLLRASRYIYFN